MGNRGRLARHLAALQRRLPYPDVLVEVVATCPARTLMVYAEGLVPAALLAAVRAWARRLGPVPAGASPWQALWSLFRPPEAVPASDPAAAALAVRRGYVAVVAPDQPSPLLAPATLDLLLAGDRPLPPGLARWVAGMRAAAALGALTLGGGLVAITSYHHSLIPGPFLVALAASRHTAPLPIALEVLLLEVLDDVLWAAGRGGHGPARRVLPLVAGALVAMACLQGGLLSPVPVGFGLLAAALRLLVPAALQGPVRAWRYLFLAAAAGLGIFGLALALFALMVGLAEARALGHPVRRPPGGGSL